MFKNVALTYLFPTVSTFVDRHPGFIAACCLFCILLHLGFACQGYDCLESDEGLEVGCHSLFCYTPHDRLMRTFLVPSLKKEGTLLNLYSMEQTVCTANHTPALCCQWQSNFFHCCFGRCHIIFPCKVTAVTYLASTAILFPNFFIKIFRCTKNFHAAPFHLCKKVLKFLDPDTLHLPF